MIDKEDNVIHNYYPQKIFQKKPTLKENHLGKKLIRIDFGSSLKHKIQN